VRGRTDVELRVRREIHRAALSPRTNQHRENLLDPEPEAADNAARPSRSYEGYQGDPADNQAVFRFVAEHLLQQRRKSQAQPSEGERDAFCLFRGPGGRMCAAGCLVPDSDYDPEWEQDGEIGTWSNPVTDYFTQRGFDLDLLLELQKIHDNTEVADWPRELQTTAEAFGFPPDATPAVAALAAGLPLTKVDSHDT
jgi:hypothetical protein